MFCELWGLLVLLVNKTLFLALCEYKYYSPQSIQVVLSLPRYFPQIMHWGLREAPWLLQSSLSSYLPWKLYLGLSWLSAPTPQISKYAENCLGFPSCATAWKLSKDIKLGQTEGLHCLFPVSKELPPCIDWLPVFWKLLCYVFFPYFSCYKQEDASKPLLLARTRIPPFLTFFIL